MFRIFPAFSLLAFVAVATAAPAKLLIRADKPGHAVSPMLYGVFFCEINRDGVGVLYAEMVQNRSFEDSEKEPLAWTIERSGEGIEISLVERAEATKDDERFNQRALRVRIPGSGEARIVNEGFKGMFVRDKQRYDFSVMLRGGFDDMAVLLRSRDGKELARQKLEKATSEEWKAIKHILTASGNDEANA